MKRKIFCQLFCLVSLLTAGCAFYSGEERTADSGTGHLHRISGSSDLKMESSRNAFPSYETGNFFYHFYAEKTSGGSTRKEASGPENSFSFLLENGGWILSCDIYYGSGLTSENYSAAPVVFSGSVAVSLSDESGDENNLKITTKIYTAENASGTASLEISSSVPAVKSALAVWKDSDGNSCSQVLSLSSLDVFNFGGKSVPAGAYKVEFSFYDGAVSSGNVSGNKICSTVKMVNIASSLKTDSWTDDGAFISGGKFVFTEKCVRLSKAKALYVSGNAAAGGSGILPGEPLDSLDSAFDLLFNFCMDGVPVCILEGTSVVFSKNLTLSENVKNLTVATYKADGTICVDKNSALQKSERGTIRRSGNLVQISDGKISGAAINFVNINVSDEPDDSAGKNIVPLVSVSCAAVCFSGCAVADDFAFCSAAENSSSLVFENVEFSGSGASSSTAVRLSGSSGALKIEGCKFEGYSKGVFLDSSETEANITAAEFSGNSVAVEGSGFKSLVLSGVTLKNCSDYGIKSADSFALSGNCALDCVFYIDDSKKSACVNFDGSYSDSSGKNSVFISMPDSSFVRGKKILSGENIESNRVNFAMEKDGWQISGGGFLYENNVESEKSRFYYVDPETSCDVPESGNYDKPYKTLQAAVDAALSENSAKSGLEHFVYILDDIEIVSSGGLSPQEDTTTSGKINTPTLCNIENSGVNDFSVKIMSFAQDSASFASVSGVPDVLGRVFKVNGAAAAVHLYVENLGFKNILLYDSADSSGKYFGAVLFMCGKNDEAAFGKGVSVSECSVYSALFYPRAGTLNLAGCKISGNKSQLNGVVVRSEDGASINISDGTEISSSGKIDGTPLQDIGIYLGISSKLSTLNFSGGRADSIYLKSGNILISGGAFVKNYVFALPESSFEIGNSYQTDEISRISYEKNVLLSGNETVFSTSSESLSASELINKFQVYDSFSADSVSSVYSLVPDSSGKKALLKINGENSAGGGVSSVFEEKLVFSADSVSFSYGIENIVKITADSSSALNWGGDGNKTGSASWNAASVSCGGENVPKSYWSESASGNVYSIKFEKSVPPGIYYIFVSATANGIAFSDTFRVTVAKN